MKKIIALVGLLPLLATTNIYAHGHHHAPKLGKLAPVDLTQPIISGGYQYIDNFFQLPKSIDLKHAHGLTRDTEDNIYLAYESKKVDKNSHAIVMFNKEGKFVRFIGDHTLAQGAPHGLDLAVENGQKFLYLSNNNQVISKIDLNGKVIWQQNQKPSNAFYKGKKYKPTDTATLANQQNVFIADGYGSSTVSVANNQTGEFTDQLLTASIERKNKQKRFATPHGITYDTRVDLLAVSDRGNKRVVYFNKKGEFVRQITGPGISEVCNTDVWNKYLLVPNLDGNVAYLDENNLLVDSIKLQTVLGKLGHNHPHDAIFMSTGDIVIGTWAPGKLSYWKRIKK